MPDPDSEGYLIDLYGDLAGILNLASGKAKNKYTECEFKTIRIFTGLDQSNTVPQGKVVGGAARQLDLHNLHKQDKVTSGRAHQTVLVVVASG